MHFLAKQHLRIQEAFLFFRFYTFLCGLQPSARKKCIKCRAACRLTCRAACRTSCRVGKLLMHIAHHTPPPGPIPYLLQALRIVWSILFYQEVVPCPQKDTISRATIRRRDFFLITNTFSDSGRLTGLYASKEVRAQASLHLWSA